MITTVQRSLKQIRYQTNQNVDYPDLDSTVEMMYLNQAQDMVADIILKLRPEMLSHYFDLTLTGATEYFIPDSIPFDYEDILMIEDYTDDATRVKTSPSNWYDRMNYFQNELCTVYTPWSIRDQYLELPEATTNKTLRVWYTRRPVPMFYGTVAAGASTTVTFPASPTAGEVRNVNDYYNGMKVYISSGDVRFISDYVGSTRVATVSSAFGTTPTTAHTVELLSSLPERFMVVMIDVATRKIKLVNDDDDTLVARFIEEEIKRLIPRIEKRTPKPNQVRKINWFD